jgi:predicted ester cyclase
VSEAAEHVARSAQTLDVVKRMETALGANSNDMAAHFHADFVWRGNAGCGTKRGLAAFRRDWQLPLRTAFTDRVYVTEKYLADGDWAACFGHIEATHSGAFMGIAPTGKRVKIPYMDFWRVEEGRIRDNPVSVDFASVLAQLGRDVFAGEGWEAFDRGERTPPARPVAKDRGQEHGDYESQTR